MSAAAPSAIILAGGRGTRLREVTRDRCPKPMVPIGSGPEARPFLDYVLAHLARQGVRDFVLCLGHLGEQLRAWFGDGARFGLSIRYDAAGEVDTGTRVNNAARLVAEDVFLVCCGDVYLPLALGPFLKRFAAHPDWLAQLAALAPYPRPNLVMDACGYVLAHGAVGDVRGQAALETGLLAMRRAALPGPGSTDDFSLAGDLFPALAAEKRLGAMKVSAPFFDIGTPPCYHAFCAFVAAGGARPLDGGP